MHSISFSLKKPVVYALALLLVFTVSRITAGTVYSQKAEQTFVNLKLHNVPVTEIFKIVENQTPFTFIYPDEVARMNKKLSVHNGNISVKELLDLLSRDLGIKYYINNTTISVKAGSGPTASKFRQTSVQGTVTDESGIPVPGASVTIKGTSVGTATDFDGNFSIRAAEGEDILVVSYIGYKTTEVTARQNIQIRLQEDVTGLEEVVVVGYGSQRKESLTGAVNTVNTENVTQRPVANLSSGMQGLSPGLNIGKNSGRPGDEVKINIRGFTSINGGAPLVLIDGIEGDIRKLNPDDVASISVLKDAGASAVYGARGAFGVILVTTKKARAGVMNVSFNSNVAWSSTTTRTDFLTDPYRVAKLVDDSFRLATGNSYTGYTEADYEELRKVAEDPSLARTIVDMRNGKEQYVHYGHTDWWNTFFRKSMPSQTYNLSVSGGSEKIKALFSFRNYETVGILKVQDDPYRTYNLRGKFDIDITDWFTLSNNIQFNNSHEVIHGGSQYGWREPWGSLIWVHALPSYNPTNPDGTALWRTELNNYTVGDGVYASMLYGKARQITDEDELTNTITANVKPLPQMNVHLSYALRRNNFNRSERSVKVPYSIFPGEIGTFGEDKLTEYANKATYNVINAYTDYTHSFGEHTLKAMIGYNQEFYRMKRIWASRQDNISDDLNSLGLGTKNPDAGGDGYEWALRGYFYRLNYNFRDKYLLELNGRYDGSSRFPEDDRWGFFPSVSAGWVISKEPFFKGAENTVNLLKLRASYGSLGNQNVPNYLYIPTLPKNTDNNYAIDGSRLEYISSPNLSPSDITWEEVNTLNLGTDFALFNNHLSGSFDWFQRNTLGMLTKGKTLPAVLGTGSPQENAADLRTRGFEVSLTYSDAFTLGNKPLRFSVTGNVSNTVTTITRFDNPNNSLLDYYEGMEIGEIWGYHSEGLFQSEEEIAQHADQSYVSSLIYSTGGLQPGDVKYRDVNGDGVVNEGENTLNDPGDRSIIGNTTPRFPYAFTVNADWNGFDLSVFFQGVAKQDWYPHTDSRSFWAMYNRPYDSFIRKDLANNMWTPENTDGFYPRLVGYTALGNNRQLGVANDRYLQDVSYLRLKNLTVGYTLPENLIAKLPLKNVRFYFSGENLFTFSGLTEYIDPEATSSDLDFNDSSTADERARAQTYPFLKTYSLGLSLEF
ncbi:SusC/RagA family TonB-linked outer membrane protein [Sinomicrobium kalidii]|uniref:SusC/RagA family TonB-linked outer membrane protein n=1 Tax=Sinomicrobium kalidii TaxID=2900738 RepID=UPI001E2A7F63|nr:SusC/RagA family TonB-linked outer membrane protein [Sinomicrobium kalidii]UGU15083.1 SusC/RagA family TonB-linked outer membrane protein [Sinomicrobium kalidii]